MPSPCSSPDVSSPDLPTDSESDPRPDSDSSVASRCWCRRCRWTHRRRACGGGDRRGGAGGAARRPRGRRRRCRRRRRRRRRARRPARPGVGRARPLVGGGACAGCLAGVFFAVRLRAALFLAGAAVSSAAASTGSSLGVVGVRASARRGALAGPARGRGLLGHLERTAAPAGALSHSELGGGVGVCSIGCSGAARPSWRRRLGGCLLGCGLLGRGLLRRRDLARRGLGRHRPAAAFFAAAFFAGAFLAAAFLAGAFLRGLLGRQRPGSQPTFSVVSVWLSSGICAAPRPERARAPGGPTLSTRELRADDAKPSCGGDTLRGASLEARSVTCRGRWPGPW